LLAAVLDSRDVLQSPFGHRKKSKSTHDESPPILPLTERRKSEMFGKALSTAPPLTAVIFPADAKKNIEGHTEGVGYA